MTKVEVDHTCFPDFLIIGAGKSGTTSLDNYLKQHPKIFMSAVKEPNFFGYELNSEDDFRNSRQIHHYRNSITNLSDYLSLFKDAERNQVKGEVSNTYMYHETAAERIKHYIPQTKLIAILRQPAERLYSRYLHLAREDKLPTKKFEDLFDRESIWWRRNDLINEGYYGKFLNKYYQLFPASNIKVFLYEQLRDNPENLVKELLTFLDIKENINIDSSIEYNKSGFVKNGMMHKIIGPHGLIKKTVQSLLPSSAFEGLKNNKALLKKVYGIRAKNLVRPKLDAHLKKRITSEIYFEDIKLLEKTIGKDLSHWYNF